MELNKHLNAKADLICGTWYLESLRLDGCFILQRGSFHIISPDKDPTARIGAFRFDLHENGELVESYLAPCGNDAMIHFWTGNWKLGEDEQTLTLQIENYPVISEFQKLRPCEAYKKGQELQIIEITKEKMHLQFKDHDVQRVEDLLWIYDTQYSY